jgi:uncharacterized repeat protein (TIGR01451 family)
VTRLGVVAYDGDRGMDGDVLRLDGTILSDALNPADNFFNSTASFLGAALPGRVPDYANLLGFDADVVRADGLLSNGATSATIRLATGGENYLPGVVTTAIDLYAPRVTLQARVRDLDGGEALPGDLLEYTVTAANAGQDAAADVVLTAPPPAGAALEPGSLAADGGGQADAPGGTPTFRLGQLATGAAAAATFRLRIGGATAPRTVLTMRPRVTYAGRTLGTRFDEAGDPVTIVVGTPPPQPIPLVSAAIEGPRLAVRLRGPARARAGRPATYSVRVTNPGGTVARGVLVRLTLPRQMLLSGKLKGARFVEGGVVAIIPALAAHEAKVVSFRVLVDRRAAGSRTLTAMVRGSGVPTVADHLATRIAPDPTVCRGARISAEWSGARSASERGKGCPRPARRR